MAKQRKVLYTITDSNFPEFKVYKSANAWWVDKNKVLKLIEAFKAAQTIIIACANACITRDQYIYFVEVHPDFKWIREVCREMPLVRAMNTVHSNMHDPTVARWYINHRHSDFNLKLRQEGSETHECPQIDTTKIEKLLSTTARNYIDKDLVKFPLQPTTPVDQALIVTDKDIADALRELALVLTQGSEEEANEIMAELTGSGVSSTSMTPKLLARGVPAYEQRFFNTAPRVTNSGVL